jgi:hypothetical protein
MSRQNKVNPGRYTQRGRLTQDDAARELRKQSLMVPAHMATGGYQEAMAAIARRRRSQGGDVCNRRDDGRDVAEG